MQQKVINIADKAALKGYDVEEIHMPMSEIRKCRIAFNAPPEQLIVNNKPAACVEETRSIFSRLKNAIFNLFCEPTPASAVAFDQQKHEAQRDFADLTRDPSVRDRGKSREFVRNSRQAISKLLNHSDIEAARNLAPAGLMKKTVETNLTRGSKAAYEMALEIQNLPEAEKKLQNKALRDGLREKQEWALSFAQIFIKATRKNKCDDHFHSPNEKITNTLASMREKFLAAQTKDLPQNIRDIFSAYNAGRHEQAYQLVDQLQQLDRNTQDQQIKLFLGGLKAEKLWAKELRKITHEAKTLRKPFYHRDVREAQLSQQLDTPQAAVV